MTVVQRAVVVGVFPDREQARAAVQDLRNAGFPAEQLGLLTRGEQTSAATTPTVNARSPVGESAVAGAATGAGIGVLWAIGIALGSLPVIGPVIAGGVLASIVASAAGGAAIGGVVGALVGLEIPEEEAVYYEREFEAGHTLVTVRADKRRDEALAILRRHGAHDINTATAECNAADSGRFRCIG